MLLSFFWKNIFLDISIKVNLSEKKMSLPRKIFTLEPSLSRFFGINELSEKILKEKVIIHMFKKYI
jgi:hypothetical protein